MKSTSFSSIYAYVGIVLVVLIQLAAGQAQEGNQDITGGEDDGGSIQNGYQSYVNDMNSAASVREAMETLSWASKGSSWMVVSAEATSEEVGHFKQRLKYDRTLTYSCASLVPFPCRLSQAQVQATPSSSDSEVAYATEAVETPVAVTPTPAAIVSTETKSTSSSSSNTLAIGLGVGIPLAVLSILSVSSSCSNTLVRFPDLDCAIKADIDTVNETCRLPVL